MPNDSAYREAFQRLKDGKPTLVPKGTCVSQNMVAKEAGRKPPDFKKSRYPELIAEIQAYVATVQLAAGLEDSNTEIPLAERRSRRSMEEKYREMKSQRDIALSMLVEADALILELSQQIARAEGARPRNHGNVAAITSSRKGGRR